MKPSSALARLLLGLSLRKATAPKQVHFWTIRFWLSYRVRIAGNRFNLREQGRFLGDIVLEDAGYHEEGSIPEKGGC